MTDRYTKIGLTVIAVALSIIAARGLIASAVAQRARASLHRWCCTGCLIGPVMRNRRHCIAARA